MPAINPTQSYTQLNTFFQFQTGSIFIIFFFYFEHVTTCNGTASFWHQRLFHCAFMCGCRISQAHVRQSGMGRGQRVILRAGDGQALLKKQQNIRYNFRFYQTFITFPTLTSGKHRERLCIRSSTLSQHFKGIYSRKRQISGIKDNWRKIWKTYCWACQKRL